MASERAWRLRRPGVAFLAALFLSTLALRPQLVGIGPLLPEIQDSLDIRHAVAALLATIPVLCMGVFAPVAPALSPLGTRTAVAVCLVAIASFGLARAVAPWAAAVLALTVPIGIAMALAGAMLPVAVKERFSRRPAFATGIYATGIQSGSILAAATAVPLAQFAGGWRAALVVFSLFAGVLVAVWLLLAPPSASERSPRHHLPRLPVKSGLVWMIVIVFGLQGALYHGFNAWLPDAYVERGWSEARAGALVAVLNLATLPGSLVIPWFADRIGSRRAYLAGAAAFAVAASAGFLAAPELAWLWAVFAGFSLSALFSLGLTLPLDVADDPRDVGAVAAVTLGVGYVLSALGPLLLGAARDASGSFDASLWLALSISIALVAASLPLTRERLRRGVAREQVLPSGI